MNAHLEVLFTPAEFERLPARDLSQTTCVVFDILRATSTIVTALGHGAAAVIPAADIPEALRAREAHPGAALAGERQGLRITAAVSGGTEFDFGNSPREFAAPQIHGRTIITTTTNGTRALRACAHAREILLGSFLNLSATARHMDASRPAQLLLVCSGTHESAAYEDALGAGALAHLLWPSYGSQAADSAKMARALYQLEKDHLTAAFARSQNGSRLHDLPELREDLAWCAQWDTFSFVASLAPDGRITRSGC